MNGTIKWLNAIKGYGFIESSEGDHFFTVKDLENGIKIQQDFLNGDRQAVEKLEGASCEFESNKGDRGLKASNVRTEV